MSALLPPKADILCKGRRVSMPTAELGASWKVNNPETIRHLRREGANELENRHRHNRLRDQTGV
jgi:hypothetical protein